MRALNFPPALPITPRVGEIAEAIRRHQVLIVAGETGSGKSTQLPKICLLAGYGRRGRIGCTQPRRLAALSLSRRLAEEMGVRWGEEVGCQIRFTDRTAPNTVIKMMTDGILLAEVQSSPGLEEYEAIVIDEAHERSLNIDFLLGFFRTLLPRRPDLRLIVTSATLDTGLFSAAFADAPVIVVEGRTHPVEVRYWPEGRPPPETGPGWLAPRQTATDDVEDAEESLGYVDLAVRAVDCLLAENHPGDFLVFLPGERDIREARDLLDGRRYPRTDVYPLFGRLSNADQMRIFAPSQHRKIILATNIAETSLTVPGIRYVVDTGLARLSRYHPATRTQRLPVEFISQGSAEQRAGRAGRVAPGVCVRLYTEAGLLARPRFTPPEIQRCNLASVILRLKAFRLGEAETFPFLEPPPERAIRAGYQLLLELGALDEQRQLTATGRQMARLPVDPAIARMLLQARREGSLTEVLAIAAGLSIQDPRERPDEERAAAEASHRQFIHPESDFLTLLNIWNLCHQECAQMSLRQLRKFCLARHLSFIRMREWRDLHDQLSVALEEIGCHDANVVAAEYHQIHRALLAGLPTHVAHRESPGQYRAPHSRLVGLFPNSALHRPPAKRFKGSSVPPPATRPAQRPAQAEWIVAGQWLELNRVYARLAARVEPQWILDFASHLCRSSYSEPHWVASAGRVLAKERILLHGLEIATRQRDFGAIDPVQATEIFILSALCEAETASPPPFLVHNRALILEAEERTARLRQSSTWGLADRVGEFYRQRLAGAAISSWADLRRWLRENHGGRDDVLRLQPGDLVEQATPTFNPTEFPDGVTFNGRRLELSYAYRPGEEHDGATLQVPIADFLRLDRATFEWSVPGLVRERVYHLLKALPKEARQRLIPLQQTAEAIAARLDPAGGPPALQLAALLHHEYNLDLPEEVWREEAVPEHLRPRLQVVDDTRRVLAAGRDWEAVRSGLEGRLSSEVGPASGIRDSALWRQAIAHWERPSLDHWPDLDLPESMAIGHLAGIPVTAWPGLKKSPSNIVGLRLFLSRPEAWQATLDGWQALAEKTLGREWSWFERDWPPALKPLGHLCAVHYPAADLAADSLQSLNRWLFRPPQPLPLSREIFQRHVAEAGRRLNGLAASAAALLGTILQQRQELTLARYSFPGLASELTRLVAPGFLRRQDWAVTLEMPRYLKALAVRAERARLNPVRDAEKSTRLAPWTAALTQRLRRPPPPDAEYLAAFLGMLEEYRVSLFAQELGTRQTVSDKRLQTALEKI